MLTRTQDSGYITFSCGDMSMLACSSYLQYVLIIGQSMTTPRAGIMDSSAMVEKCSCPRLVEKSIAAFWVYSIAN